MPMLKSIIRYEGLILKNILEKFMIDTLSNNIYEKIFVDYTNVQIIQQLRQRKISKEAFYNEQTEVVKNLISGLGSENCFLNFEYFKRKNINLVEEN